MVHVSPAITKAQARAGTTRFQKRQGMQSWII
jgi:hypothetical protein